MSAVLNSDSDLPRSNVLVTGVIRGHLSAALEGKVVDNVLTLRSGGLLIRFKDGTEVKLVWMDHDEVPVTGTITYEFRRYENG